MAHPDLDRLLEYCVPFAQKMLEKRNAFLPFAAKIGLDGDLSAVAVYTGDDTPLPTTLIEEFNVIFKNLGSTGEILAAAICYDGMVSIEGSEKKDAITIGLEHSNGECVTVYLPYSKKLFRGYKYEPLFATAGQRQFFT